MIDKDKRYRFKTEREFIKEYGNNWKEIIRCWADEMDYLFGKEYILYIDHVRSLYDRHTGDLVGTICKQTEHYEYLGTVWYIYECMLTEYRIEPTYEPRKLIRE